MPEAPARRRAKPRRPLPDAKELRARAVAGESTVSLARELGLRPRVVQDLIDSARPPHPPQPEEELARERAALAEMVAKGLLIPPKNKTKGKPPIPLDWGFGLSQYVIEGRD